MSLGACNLLSCPAVVISKELYIFHVQQVVLIRFVTQSNLNFRICCLPTNLHQIAQNYTRTEHWSEKKQSTGSTMVLSRWCFPRNQGRLATTVCSPMNYWRQNGFQSSTIFLRQRPSWDFLQQIIILAIYEAQQIVGNGGEIMMVLLLLGERKDDKWKLRLVSHERLILDSRQVVENFYISYLWQNVFLCLCQKYLCGKRSQRVVWWL